MLKITSGIYRGRKITTPGGETHPMGERERIALFNMIAPYLPGAQVLDAFAGSGALGIEALSRGVSEVVFVEKNRKAASIIAENLKNLELSDFGIIIVGDIKNFTTDRTFDVILADPPYNNFRLDEIELLVKLLNKNGVLVLSHPNEALEIIGLKLINTHKYAAAHLSVYVKR
ncbi:16S rRNA (guanine(966)-N(2))-methyltransferase RsmD [Candidatus Saccharibacteria bacterium]|nr:16S rRNA (guanine(966)-N(2))-methyltransferase RsmD [Candidatus Saccharibacteria bacterium]